MSGWVGVGAFFSMRAAWAVVEGTDGPFSRGGSLDLALQRVNDAGGV